MPLTTLDFQEPGYDHWNMANGQAERMMGVYEDEKYKDAGDPLNSDIF